MALVAQRENLDDLDESLHEHYTKNEESGKFFLDIIGNKSPEDVEKLTVALGKEREDHKKVRGRLSAFGDLTVESLAQLKSDNEDMTLRIEVFDSESDDDKNKKVEELAEHRVLARVKPLERQLEALTKSVGELTGQRDDAQEQLTRSTISRAVQDAAVGKEIGINSDAVSCGDVANWGASNFEITEDGSVVSRDLGGMTPGLSPKEIFLEMRQSGARRHWFGDTQSANANDSHGKGDGANPLLGDKPNLTEFGRICKADPERAIRLATAAKKPELVKAAQSMRG